MTSHVLRLPASLDPLIAEAKRRARQRRVLVAVTGVVVVGVGIGAAFVASGSSNGASRLGPSNAVAVEPVGGNIEQPNGPNPPGADPGVFSPRFGIGVVVANGSKEPIILERVDAVLHSWSPLGQIGARFKHWKPPTCVSPTGLPCTTFPITAERPISAERPTPLRVAPGHEALVQLNFRLLTCTRREAQEPISLLKLAVFYRLPNGTQIQQDPPFLNGYVGGGPGLPLGHITTRPCRR